MKVCLETTALRARLTGIGYYVNGLSQALLEHHADLTLLAFDGLRSSDLAQSIAAFSTSDGQRSTPFSESAFYKVSRQISPLRAALRQVKLARFKSIDPSIDIFHALNFMPPASTPMRTIPLVYDVSHVRFPHTHPQERVSWLTAQMARLKEHPIVNTISEFSADEIADIYNYPRTQIRVTPPGIAPAYLEKPEQQTQISVGKHRLHHRQFALMVGTLEPRKNYSVVINAYKAMRPELRKSIPLIIVGGYGWGADVTKDAQELLSEGSLIIADYVPQSSLRQLYANARVLLFPSLYEGFGLPVMEAMASLTPVIGSDIPVLREIGKGMIDFAEISNVDAWLIALETAYATDISRPNTSALSRRLTAARNAAMGYTWQRNAALTHKMYLERMSVS